MDLLAVLSSFLLVLVFNFLLILETLLTTMMFGYLLAFLVILNYFIRSIYNSKDLLDYFIISRVFRFYYLYITILCKSIF